jgi:predicted ATP-grasp superfamily ATP-dependent carboligase
VIVGLSTRAAAESAARAGFEVTAIDAFADLDQHSRVRALSVRRDFGARFTANAVARASRTIESDAVAYLSNFENHPSAVARLAAGRALWGNPPDVLRRVRDPLILAETLRRRGLATPNVNANGISNGPNDPNVPNDPNDLPWLVKPRASGGGRGVRDWHQGMPVPRHAYLQQFIEGLPGSIVFVAAGGRAVPLGITRQLIGEESFGSSGFGFCGNIVAQSGGDFSDALVAAACDLTRVVAEEFGVVGVNGIDFVAHGDVPYAIEVNPRWCASMELLERAYGVSIFGAHAAACATGVLPAFDLSRARQHAHTWGKAIVFARHDVTLGDTRGWLDDATVRDVPRAGEAILAGAPICTVLAEGAGGLACHAALVTRAGCLYADDMISPCVSS